MRDTIFLMCVSTTLAGHAITSLHLRRTGIGGNSGSGKMNALCIVGEWRTFAMPAVHASILEASQAWNADVFMFYHTRYDSVAMSHKHRENASSCAFNSYLLSAFKVARATPLPCPKKEWKASVQFKQISACFRHAMRSGTNYRWLIRSRPDYLIHDPQPLPAETNRIIVGYPKPDMLFAVPTRRISAWFDGMTNTCHPGCCIEYIHKIFTSKSRTIWRQHGAIARGVHRLTYRMDWTPDADTISGLECNITSRPGPPARAPIQRLST